MKRKTERRVILAVLIAVGILIVITLILGAEANKRADETIARADRILEEVEK